MYKMIWTQRSNPDNTGEGLLVKDKEDAEAICKWHNWAYPAYHHRAIPVEDE